MFLKATATTHTREWVAHGTHDHTFLSSAKTLHCGGASDSWSLEHGYVLAAREAGEKGIAVSILGR